MSAVSSERFHAWATRLRASDEAAYGDLYHTFHPVLHRYDWYITRDTAATDDVLQEVFIKLWTIRDRIDPDRSLKALLYQMARNFALNHERSRRRMSDADIDDLDLGSAPQTESEITAATLEMRLREWIAQLPPRRREAFCLSRFDGLSHDEIAAVMELAPKTVNNHIVLALQTLRQRLASYDPDALLDA